MSVSVNHLRPPPVRFELDGGVVGFVETSGAVPLVSVVLGFRSGAVVDPAERDGLARIMVRMLRRGAKGLSSNEIESAIDRLGAEFGVDVGPTSITLHGQVIRRNIVPFCDLLVRLLSTPVFSVAELGKLQRESVAELLDLLDNDRALASIALRRGLFGAHPYGRSTAGMPSTLESITQDDVFESYRTRLVRSELVVGFAGAISESESKVLAERIAKALPEGPRVPMHLPEPKQPRGRRLVLVDKPDRTQTQTMIGRLGTAAADPDHFALLTATAVLGGTFTSRMMQEIRSKRGWSYGTSARLSVERQRHAFVMSAAPSLEDCAPCVGLELDLLSNFVSEGITSRELEFITNYLVRSHAFDIDTAPKRLSQAFETELLELPRDYYPSYLTKVQEVTIESANKAIKKRLSADDLIIVVVGTESELVPRLQREIEGLFDVTVVPYDLQTTQPPFDA